MSRRYDFAKSLRNARDQRLMGMNSAAVKEYGTLVENVIEYLYTEAWSYLTPTEKQRIAEVESKIVKQNPLQVKFTLGNWIELFQKAGLFSLISQHKNLSQTAFNYDLLMKLKDIRDRCTHEGYEPGPEIIDNFCSSVSSILKETKLLDEKTIQDLTTIQKIEVTREEPKLDELAQHLAEKIRIMFTRDFRLEYETVIEVDFGKFYDVDAVIEVFGVYSDKGKIIILTRMTKEQFHEDVMERVYEHFSTEIRKLIYEKVPEAKGFETKILFYDNMGGLESSAFYESLET